MHDVTLMIRLEHQVGDVAKAKDAVPELQKLITLQSRMTKDYDLNSKLRASFRYH